MNGPSKICGRQPVKNLKWYGLLRKTISLQVFKGYSPQILFGPFLNTLTQLFIRTQQSRSVFRTQSNIWDGAFYNKSLRLKNRERFSQEVSTYIFDLVLNTPLLYKLVFLKCFENTLVNNMHDGDVLGNIRSSFCNVFPATCQRCQKIYFLG